MTANFQSYSVLIVDEPRSARQMHELLQILGFRQFCMAENVDTALQMVMSTRLDLAIINPELKDSDGVIVAHKIRRTLPDPQRRLPILVVSPRDDVKTVLRAHTAGANHVVILPCSVQSMTKAVQLVLRDRRQFVVEPGYVGPDARQRIDDDYDGPERRSPEVSNRTTQRQVG